MYNRGDVPILVNRWTTETQRSYRSPWRGKDGQTHVERRCPCGGHRSSSRRHRSESQERQVSPQYMYNGQDVVYIERAPFERRKEQQLLPQQTSNGQEVVYIERRKEQPLLPQQTHNGQDVMYIERAPFERRKEQQVLPQQTSYGQEVVYVKRKKTERHKGKQELPHQTYNGQDVVYIERAPFEIRKEQQLLPQQTSTGQDVTYVERRKEQQALPQTGDGPYTVDVKRENTDGKDQPVLPQQTRNGQEVVYVKRKKTEHCKQTYNGQDVVYVERAPFHTYRPRTYNINPRRGPQVVDTAGAEVIRSPTRAVAYQSSPKSHRCYCSDGAEDRLIPYQAKQGPVIMSHQGQGRIEADVSRCDVTEKGRAAGGAEQHVYICRDYVRRPAPLTAVADVTSSRYDAEKVYTTSCRDYVPQRCLSPPHYVDPSVVSNRRVIGYKNDSQGTTGCLYQFA